jgi:hypothetical protein
VTVELNPVLVTFGPSGDAVLVGLVREIAGL